MGGALVIRSEDKKGGQLNKTITAHAFKIVSVHTGEIKSDQHYYLIRHYKPHSGWHEMDTKASNLHSLNLGPMLADAGVVVHDAEAFRLYVRESVDALHAKERARMQFAQFGWKKNNTAFLYGDRLYTAGGVQTTACSEELRYRAQWLQPVLGGSIEGWKQAVDCLMGKGSEGQSFAVLASFGAILMRFLEDNEGGAVVSLVTPHSGAGKTTSLTAASSVWANRPQALALTTIDTKVSKAITLETLANLPVTYDEFSNKDPDVVREWMVMFTNGHDKMRGTSEGGIIHSSAGWQTMLLTASNRSLVDSLQSTGESDAPAYRILEFPVESAGDLKLSEAARLKKQMEDNAGWAGDAYLRYLLQPAVLEWTKKRLALMTDEIFAKGAFRKEHRFWVRALAATATAALIVEKLGLISFSPGRIMGWAIGHFAQRIEPVVSKRGTDVATLSRFLNEHIAETLLMPGPAEGRKPQQPIGDKPRNKVFVRVEVCSEYIYIAEHPLREWVDKKAGGGYRALIDGLRDKEVLIDHHRYMTLTAGSELRGGQVWAVVVDGGHPSLTGVMREVNAVVKDEKRREKLRTIG